MAYVIDSGIILPAKKYRVTIYKCDGAWQDFSNVVNVINNDSVLAVSTESTVHYFRLKFLREWTVKKVETNENT